MQWQEKDIVCVSWVLCHVPIKDVKFLYIWVTQDTPDGELTQVLDSDLRLVFFGFVCLFLI